MKKIILLVITFLVIVANQSCQSTQAAMPINKSTSVTEAIHNNMIPPRFYDKRLLPLIITVRQKLENNDTYYKWTNYTSCNVGLFAQLCTNASESEIKRRVNNEYADFIRQVEIQEKNGTEDDPMSWTLMVNYYCGITGKSVCGIIGDLQKAGFTSSDISHLEYLNDKYILSKTDINNSAQYYTLSDNLIKYLKAWEEIIKEQKN
jgi:hypothetical protein